MMDPAEAQNLINLSSNVAILNQQVAGLMDTMSALVRHLERGGMTAAPNQPMLTQSPVQQIAVVADSLASLARHWQRAQLNMQPGAPGPNIGGGLPGPNIGGGLPGPGGDGS